MEEIMASQGAEELKAFLRNWATIFAARPDMPLDELRLIFEHWGDMTAEPGGVDYLETNAGGVTASGPSQKTAPKTGSCFACTAAATSPRRCTRIASFTVILRRRSAVGPSFHITAALRSPAPVDDAVTAYKWILDQGVAPVISL
jgi:monoterpene epsilon-lactone hydrolase